MRVDHLPAVHHERLLRSVLVGVFDVVGVALGSCHLGVLRRHIDRCTLLERLRSLAELMRVIVVVLRRVGLVGNFLIAFHLSSDSINVYIQC